MWILVDLNSSGAITDPLHSLHISMLVMNQFVESVRWVFLGSDKLHSSWMQLGAPVLLLGSCVGGFQMLLNKRRYLQSVIRIHSSFLHASETHLIEVWSGQLFHTLFWVLSNDCGRKVLLFQDLSPEREKHSAVHIFCCRVEMQTSTNVWYRGGMFSSCLFVVSDKPGLLRFTERLAELLF